MSNREVMQQALEAIRIFREWETGQDYESCRATVLARALAAEESLGAALAEPEQDAELSAALGWPGGISTPILDRHVLLDLVAKQRSAALAEPQEPLGWAVQVGTHSVGRRQGKPRYALFFNKADAEHLADRTKEARPEPFYLEGA